RSSGVRGRSPHVRAGVDVVRHAVAVAVGSRRLDGHHDRGLLRRDGSRLDERRALQSRARLQADSQDDRAGVAAVETSALTLDNLEIANEGSQPERARLADGKGEAHRPGEAESIETAGAHVE